MQPYTMCVFLTRRVGARRLGYKSSVVVVVDVLTRVRVSEVFQPDPQNINRFGDKSIGAFVYCSVVEK